MMIPYSKLSQQAIEWITAHPYQSAVYVVNGVVFITPAAVTVPLFGLLGFTQSGPAAGKNGRLYSAWSSFNPITLNLFTFRDYRLTYVFSEASAASGVMSYFGFVPAGGVYATLQSAAMGGYGASAVAGATQAGAVASSVLSGWLGWYGNGR